MTDSIEFGFNPAPFIKGFQKMADAMSNFKKSATDSVGKLGEKVSGFWSNNQKQSEKSSKNSNSSMGVMSNGINMLIRRIGGIAIAMVGVRAIMQKLPEVGRTFSIVGDIFSRNLLQPLRKELRPYLQWILNWTRDHRAMFVQWGQILANIFRTIVTIAKSAIEAVKPLFEVIGNLFKRFFGDSVKTISEGINVLLFKLAVVAIFLGQLLEPVAKGLGQILTFLYNIGEAFSGGFFDSFGDKLGSWTDIIGEFLTAIGDLWTAFTNLGGEKQVLNLFRILGQLWGGILKIALMSITDGLKLLTALLTGDITKAPIWIQQTADGFKKIMNVLYSVDNAIDKWARGLADKILALFKWAFDQIKMIGGFVSGFFDKLGGGKKGTDFNVTTTNTSQEIKNNPYKGGMPAITPNSKTTNKTTEIKSEVRIDNIEIKGADEESAKQFIDTIRANSSDSVSKGLRRQINQEMAESGA